jgi:hypothetical protein
MAEENRSTPSPGAALCQFVCLRRGTAENILANTLSAKRN